MDSGRDLLSTLASKFAEVVPEIDATVDHQRWQPGIGPFEEDRQLEFLIGGLDEEFTQRIETEVRYPDNRMWCDLVLSESGINVPVEAKLIRFRRDNGDIEPTAFNRVFSPFPGRSPSLLSDAKALTESAFPDPGGLLGLYYESREERFEQMEISAVAEKVVLDTEYWYDIDLTIAEIARFEGLRHPVFDRGAIITWRIAPLTTSQ